MNLPDALMKAVRQRAEREGRTVTSLVEQALRDLLAQSAVQGERVERLPTFGAAGDRLLIDLDDRDAVFDALDADGR